MTRVPAPRRAEGHRLRARGDRGAARRHRALLRHQQLGRRGAAQALPRGRSRGGRHGAAPVRGEVRLRPLRPEGGVHARLPRDGRDRLEGGRLPRRQRVLVPARRPRPRRVRRRGGPARGLARGERGQRHLARREGRGTLGVARRDRRDHPGGRAGRRLPRLGGRGRDPRLPAPEGRRARLEVPAGDRAVRRDVPRARRPLPVREVRARRELLGDGLRHAVLHAARPPGHPLPVHPQLLLPARDPPQLVGQLGLRGLRERELVRGPDRLHGRPPDPGAAGAGRGVPARHPAEVPQLRARRARLPAHRVPLAPQRGDRGGGVREDADGLPHDPAADRGRGLPQVGGPLLPRVPREAGLVRGRAEVARGRGGPGPRPVLRRPRREARGGAAAGEAQRPARVDGRRLRGRLRDRADPAGGAAAARRAGRRADPREARHRHGPARSGPRGVHGEDRGGAGGPPRRSLVRPLPPPRPARDARLDRPDLRRAAHPRGPARRRRPRRSRTATGS